jgi:outer membrane autotransporter protein
LGYWGSDQLAQGGSAASNGAFGGAVGSFTNVKASNGNAGYSTSIGGIYVGVERAASFDMGDVLLGISAGYSLGSVQSANDSANSRFGNIGAYGAVSNDGWLIAGSASFAFGSFDTKRLLNVGGGTVTASNDLGATVFSTDFEVSYDIAPELGYANASIRPYGRINANFASIQGGTETGAGILNLTVNGTNASQIFAETGTKISTVITEGDITWRPEVGLGYRYLLSERGLVSASQLAVVGANFTSTVARRNRSNIVASAGISWEKDNLSGHATYEGSFSGNAIDNKLSAGIEIGF